MAQNKNALIRYKTIDKCLQNHYRNWTLKDLIDACSEALYEYEGKDSQVSKRTVQLDIQLMRSDKLGYNAPIEVYDKKYYRYAEAGFSITDIPITENDMNVLSETVEMLKQFKDFSLFSEIGGIIQRLEDKVYTEQTNHPSIIHLDKNEKLKGLEHLDVLYQTILKKICLDIMYKSFKARDSSLIQFHPYILKEYNNRWFLVGMNHFSKKMMNLALDRIDSIEYNLDLNYQTNSFDGDDYYKNTIGVTVLPEEHVEEIVFMVNRSNAPYVVTKPFHHSQEILSNENGDITFKIKVHHNYELERMLLGFGSSLEVISPTHLRRRIKRNLKSAVKNYE